MRQGRASVGGAVLARSVDVGDTVDEDMENAPGNAKGPPCKQGEPQPMVEEIEKGRRRRRVERAAPARQTPQPNKKPSTHLRRALFAAPAWAAGPGAVAAV